jgi:hypothetical protein
MKIAQNETQLIKKFYLTKRIPKSWVTWHFSKKLHNENNWPIGKNSSNLGSML